MTTRQRKAKGRVVYKFRLPVPLDPGWIPLCVRRLILSVQVWMSIQQMLSWEPSDPAHANQEFEDPRDKQPYHRASRVELAVLGREVLRTSLW